MVNVVSLSGGKDSTAMLHLMLDRGESVHSAVFFDTGWEFPEMHAHLDLVERKTGIQVVRLKPSVPFDYLMLEHRVKGKPNSKPEHKEQIGYGWPWINLRWCTAQKRDAIKRYHLTIADCVPCIGFGADEARRARPGQARYPLIEYGVTEAEALKYCRRLGYTWGGLYDIFKRVSCWCCPLQSLKDLRLLRKHRPELWAKLHAMDAKQPLRSKGFYKFLRVADLERRFATEDKQCRLWAAA